jgi:hypothetical protein
MASEAIPYVLKLRGSESRFENAENLKSFRLWRSEGAHETEFFDSSDSCVDGSEITHLIVGFTQELAYHLAQLLSRPHQARRVLRRRVETGEFFP